MIGLFEYLFKNSGVKFSQVESLNLTEQVSRALVEGLVYLYPSETGDDLVLPTNKGRSVLNTLGSRATEELYWKYIEYLKKVESDKPTVQDLLMMLSERGRPVHSTSTADYQGHDGTVYPAELVQEALDAGLVYHSSRTNEVKWLGLTLKGRATAK